VMCAAPQTTEQLEAILTTGAAAMQASAKNEAFAYSVASGAVQVSTANLTASEYWTGAAWAAISETAPSAPHQLWAHLLVVDAAGNAGSAQNIGAIKTVADRNAPTLSSFGATQSPAGYSFSLDASTRIADTRAGPLKTYFFLATAAIGDAKAFVATHSANAAVAKNEAVAYSSSSGAVAPPALTASKFWNGSAWTDVVEATLTLNAHFVVLDAAGLAASATVAKTVTDVTAPAFSGTVALTAEGETSVKAAWSAGITDGRGVTEGRVYYSATAPAATTSAGIAAWKAAATTYYAAVSPLTLLSAAGSATVTGLTAGTTYHAYLCVKDAAGNELNVATAPASVATASPPPPAPTATAGFAPHPSDNTWWYNTDNVIICSNSHSSYSNDIGYLFRNAVFVSLGNFSSTPTKDLLVYGSFNSDPNNVWASDPGVGIWDRRGPTGSDTVARRQIALNLLAAQNVVWAAPIVTSSPMLSSLAALLSSGWASGLPSNTFDGTFKPNGYNTAGPSIGSIFALGVESPFTLDFNLHMGASTDGPRMFFEMLQGWNNGKNAVVGRTTASFGVDGSVYVDDANSASYSVQYATSAIALGQTVPVRVEYAAPMLTVTVSGVKNAPSVDVSASPYNIGAGPVTVKLGSSTGAGGLYGANGITAHYSAVVLTRPSKTPSFLPPAGKDRYVFEVTSGSHFSIANGHASGSSVMPAGPNGGMAASSLQFVYANDTSSVGTRFFPVDSSGSPGQSAWLPVGAMYVYDVPAGSPFTGFTMPGISRATYRGGLRVRKNNVVAYQDSFLSTDSNRNYGYTISW
jgi:hypothetical protein